MLKRLFLQFFRPESRAVESRSVDSDSESKILANLQPAAMQVGEVQVFKFAKEDAAKVEQLVQAFKVALKFVSLFGGLRI